MQTLEIILNRVLFNQTFDIIITIPALNQNSLLNNKKITNFVGFAGKQFVFYHEF